MVAFTDWPTKSNHITAADTAIVVVDWLEPFLVAGCCRFEERSLVIARPFEAVGRHQQAVMLMGVSHNSLVAVVFMD